jgi:hypothetical protein
MTEKSINEVQNETAEEHLDDEAEEHLDDSDYEPDFVKNLRKNPPLLGNECQVDFEMIFESYEFTHSGRAKTDAEYLLVYQASVLTMQLIRYERMKVAIVSNQRPPAAESLFRRTHDKKAESKDELSEARATARESSSMYFADPEYRKKLASKLEKAGYSSEAVDAEAFLRALHPLATIDRLIASAEKRLMTIIKKLEGCYASRDPEMKMSQSIAAGRAGK